jgi:hypothetical protein
MNRRSLGLLGGVTALAVALALWLSYPAADKSGIAETGALLFPGLGDGLPAVEGVSLSGPQGRATLALRDGQWTVEERFGYAADLGQIRALLAGLVRSRRLEPKTADPARLESIGLGDEALSLSLIGRAGAELAALKIGRNRDVGVGGERQTFVWAEGDERSWLVSSLPYITTSPILWLDKEIINLSSSRISGVTITRSDGDSLSLSGQANNVAALVIAGQGADETLQGAPANETMTALAGLQFDDVAAAGEISGAVVASARFTTFDGLVVEVWVLQAENGGGSWARFSAEYDRQIFLDDNAPARMPEAPADGAAEADALNARWSGWRYRLAGMDAEALTRPRSELITAAD